MRDLRENYLSGAWAWGTSRQYGSLNVRTGGGRIEVRKSYVSNPAGIPRLIEAHTHILDALVKRDREKGRLWVDRHLRDWRAGFERSGRDLDTPVELYERARGD